MSKDCSLYREIMKLTSDYVGRVLRYWPVLPVLVGLLFFITGFNSFNGVGAVDGSMQSEVAIPTILLHHTIEVPAEEFHREKLWLARAIYSETKRPHEQELVGWVVRNRYETRYRGKSTYEDVVLDPKQFSAFRPGTSSRRFLTLLDTAYYQPQWQSALRVAEQVMLSQSNKRPFTITTRHFYSERSMPNEEAPIWVSDKTPVMPTRHQVDERRFRFYDGVI